MAKYTFEINLDTATEREAETKVKALIDLARHLKTAELEKLAHIVKFDPVKTALAKKYLGV